MNQRLFNLLLLGGLTTPVLANSTNETLPTMVVTATRAEQDSSELAAGTTVYTRKDIARLQINALPDLLKNSIGIDMTQQGGYGKISSIFMRGTNSNHVLVLIDGIKVGSATTGTSPFELIPIDQIERVEIIRGPQSSLYGSEAIGGVIHIFTRKGTHGEQPKFTVETGGGSYDTAKVAAGVNGSWNTSWYAFSASHLTSQGFNARQPTTGFFAYNEPDHDGYENTSGNARIGHRFANNAEIEAFFLRAQGTTEYDGSFQNKTHFIEQVFGLSGSMAISDNWRATVRLGQSRDDGDYFAPNNTLASRFNTTRWNATWLNQFTITDKHQLIIGSDYRVDEIDTDSNNPYSKNSRYDFGGFGELHSRLFDNHYITASLRGDGNEAFGNYVTGNISWRYHAPLGLSPFASFGNAFKAPSFNELYYPYGGDVNLKPEESQSVEAGLTGDYSWAKWEVRAYHTEIENLILWLPPSFSANNIGKVKIDGIETEIGTQFYGWNTKLNLSLLNPHDDTNHSRLARRADKLLSFDLSKSFEQLDIGTTVLAQGERFDNPQNTIKVAGFVTVDLRAAYHLNKNWLFSAKLSNLLDQNYQTASTYNNAGRNFFISVQYTH